MRPGQCGQDRPGFKKEDETMKVRLPFAGALLVAVGIASLGYSALAHAQGLTPEGIAKLDAALDAAVHRGFVAGGVALVERHGEVVYENVFGKQSLETGVDMAPDTIFRIFSMTKPVTSVAVLILVDEGKLALDDPAEQYLPELANPVVGVERLPAERPATVKDLLLHTAGLAYGLTGNDPVTRLYREGDVLRRDETLEEKVRRIGTLPLRHHPGTQWDYSIATDVLGRLVEVVSGQPLDAFFEERIFAPLGMVDTGFHVPEEKTDRFAEIYDMRFGGNLVPAESPAGYDFHNKPIFLSGGGGLVSTARDYLTFCRMLLNGGAYDGVRILERETVDLMTRDHLGDLPISMIGHALGMGGAGFGLGVSVTKTAFYDTRGDVGEYNWGGAASTIFWVDPKQALIGIYLVQIFPSNFTTGLQFKRLVYEALEK